MPNPANETFTAFIQGAPAANLPLGSSDLIAVIQNGVTKSAPGQTLIPVPGNQNVTSITAASTYAVVTTDQFIAVNKAVGSPTGIIFPATATVGRIVEVADCAGDAWNNNITISGSVFDGRASSQTINTAFGTMSFEWVGTFWKLK